MRILKFFCIGLLSVSVGVAVVGTSSQPAQASLFKKIGKSLKKATKTVTKPIGKAAKSVEKRTVKIAKGVGKGTASAAKFTVKTGGKVAKGAVKETGKIAKAGGKVAATAGKAWYGVAKTTVTTGAKGAVAVGKFGLKEASNGAKDIVRTTDPIVRKGYHALGGDQIGGVKGNTIGVPTWAAGQVYQGVTSPVRASDGYHVRPNR